MLQPPGQIQRLLAALASQPSYSIPDSTAPGVEPQPNSSQLTSYENPYDFYRGFSGEPNGSFNPVALLTETDAVAQHQHLAEDTSRLQESYKDAEEIDKDVNALQSSITSLIESLGLDPNIMDPGQIPNAGALPDAPAVNTAPLSPGLDGTNADSSALDFDFDAFLNEFSGNGEENNYIDHIDSTAFLDEVPSPDSKASPVTSIHHDSPNFSTKTTRKRKSDIADMDQQHTKSSNYGAKSKKKKIIN